jgi:fatty-acyl-CoA synthase
MPVDRRESQEKLAKLSAATLQHTPGQKYTVGDRLEERAAECGERVFLRYGQRRLGYAEVNAGANRVADVARDAGLARGDVVALAMENRPEFLLAWMGLCKLGVTTALLNSNARGRPFHHALEVSGARHLIVGGECLDALEGLPEAALRGRTLYAWPDPEKPDSAPAPQGAVALTPLLAAASAENPDPRVRDGLVAGAALFYIYTSGTTGLPKAARLSHMRYLGVGDGMSTTCGYGPDDVLYCVLPLYHGAGVMVVISSALAQGASVLLRRKFSASRFWYDVREHGVTGCQYIGEICRYLMNQPPSDRDRDHGLRVMTGAGLGPDLYARFQQRFGVERILEGWSSTEANTSLINLDNEPGSCGRIPFPELHNGRLVRYDVETDTHPRDAEGRMIECAPGEVGEFIGMILDLPDSGAGRFEGYTSAGATDAKILRDVFQPGDAWYRSGDLLRRDEHDYFYFVDRIGDTYRWKSENVSTQEVAEALSGFPGLEIANVYGVRVAGSEGRAGMAALVMRDAFDGEAFFAWTEQHLPRYAAPVFVRLSAQADMTTTFKLRKVDLQREGYDPARVADPLWVRDESARAYVPLDDEALRRCGLPAFSAGS